MLLKLLDRDVRCQGVIRWPMSETKPRSAAVEPVESLDTLVAPPSPGSTAARALTRPTPCRAVQPRVDVQQGQRKSIPLSLARGQRRAQA
eukprot:658746-Pyramimonas_sp.AAC.1